MKFLKSKKVQNYIVRILATLIVVFIISCSMTIDSIEQPSSINGGETLNVTLNVKIVTDVAQTSKLMIAVLVPKVWRAAQNTTMSFTSEQTTGVQKMSLVPNGPAPNGNGLNWPDYLAQKVGNGGNLINEWEWVAFYSDQDYALGGGLPDLDVTVSVRIKTSMDNLSYKPAYVVANSTDGLSASDRFGKLGYNGCFTVNGEGDLIDFCNAQLAAVDPRNSTDNDIITVVFDPKVADNKLKDENDIYWCATGITTTGERIELCTVNDKSKLRSIGSGRWNIDVWPRQFFSLTEDKTLEKIEYYFTDVTGTKKVGYGGGTDPFIYTFKCP